MTSPQERLPISLSKVRSPSFRVLESSSTTNARGGSPFSDDAIWARLREAGFDEESIKRRDKASLIAYIAKLEAEIFDYQHHMGLLILERKDWTSKYDQLKASADSAEMKFKLNQAAHLSELAEVKKREEGLKRALGIEKECIANIEKTLHEMRSECAENKIAAEAKMAEACNVSVNAQNKFTEAEAKLNAAESLQTEVSRYNRAAERKLRELEEREDELRRRLISFKSECDAKEKEISIERQTLCDRQNIVQQGQERLLKGQTLLNQREEYIFGKTQELIRLEKELEVSKANIEDELKALNEEKTNLGLNLAVLSTREESLSKKEALLGKREQELHSEHEKLVSREFDEIQSLKAELETTAQMRKAEVEAEMEQKCKIIDNELDAKRRSCELREVDIRQREESVLEREYELEVQSMVLVEKEKDLTGKFKLVEEKNENLHAAEKVVELQKAYLEKEKEEIKNMKLDLQKSMISLENVRNEVEEAQGKLEASKFERKELLDLEMNLKEEIDSIRAQKHELMAEAEELKAEKSKFEAEWEVIDEKRDELRREAQHVYEERKVISQFLKDERHNLKLEKDALRDQFKRDCEALSSEREAFVSKLEQERLEWFSRIHHERDNFVQDIETQKRELENCINKRRDEIESYLMGKEEAFEQEKTKDLQYISSLKEMVAQEREHVASEMKRLEKERVGMILDRDCREKEQDSLKKLVEELQIQEEKLKEQRELLHADREKINAQILLLNNLEDLKTASEDIALSKLHETNIKSTRRLVKRHTNSQSIERDGEPDLLVQRIDSSDFVGSRLLSRQAQDSGSPLSSAPLSWIRRCTDLIFKNSPEKVLINNGEMSQITDFEDAKLLEDKYPLVRTLEYSRHLIPEKGHLAGRKRLNNSSSPYSFESQSSQCDSSKKRKQHIDVGETSLEEMNVNCVVSTTISVEDGNCLTLFNQIPQNPEQVNNLANGNHEE
ncbi:hypothetical protein GIB67_017872 [Kingdonia uniflora]|uniref:Nuclear matrix constituent protein 1-like protein n=1 Tax=Kingdonia uniflora TaxID=39325 RepID=A0A7J7ML07_9MAGN|nr:hypothetical protein GIB67_017872 [Kingdonia uniflora]